MEGTSSMNNKANPVSYRNIIRLAIPIVLSSLSATVMSIVDRGFASSFDITQFSSIMTSATYANTVAGIFTGIISYMVYYVSQYYGSESYENCAKIFWQSIYLSIVFSIVLLLIVPIAAPIFKWLGHSTEVVVYEKEYFFYVLSAGCVNLFVLSITNLFKGVSKVGVVFTVGVLSNIVNVFLDWLLIFGNMNMPELGAITGGGIATLSSNIFALVALVFYLSFNKEYWKPYRILQNRTLNLKTIGQILRYSIPTSIHNFVRMAYYSICLLIISIAGEIGISSANIVFTIESISILPVTGIVTAISIIATQEKGANRSENIGKVLKKGVFLILSINVIIMVLYIFFPSGLIILFNNIKEPDRFKQISDIAKPLIRIMALWISMDSIHLVISNTLRALGDTKFFMMVSIISPPLFYIVIPLICVQNSISIIWIWWGLLLFTVVIFVSAILRYLGGRWKHIEIIAKEENIIVE